MKLDNNADDVMRLISETIRSVPPSPSKPWQSRIVLGCWAAKYLPLCSHYLPGFSVSHIGFSVLVASYFFTVPNVSFNMNQAVLMPPWGKAFVRKAQRDGRPVYAWTVNDARRMRWDIQQGLDGVVTDDPELFLEVRRGWRDGMKHELRIQDWLDVMRVNFFALIYSVLFQLMLGFGQEKRLVKVKQAAK